MTPRDLPPEAELDFHRALRDSTDRALRGIELRPADEPIDEEQLVRWAEQDLGLKLRSVPKVLDIFLTVVRDFIARRMIRLAILGPRGGGKTRLAAALQLVAYRFFGFECNNIGASLEQAHRCFEHCRDAHYRSADLAEYSTEVMATRIRSKRGDDITINAASDKSVRGLHPVGSSGGGMLVLDEAALIPDKILNASKGQMVTARPSVILQPSTMGESPVGKFYELLQDPKSVGYQMKQFDCFDVAARCPYDCATTCPVPEHFAKDFTVNVRGVPHAIHSAYCGGRAHDVDGWMAIDEIAQNFRETDCATFEREMLGKASHTVGRVYDPRLLDAAVARDKDGHPEDRWLADDHEEHERRFQLLDKAVGVDWGFSGQTAIVYAIRLRDALLVYRWETFTHERFSVIRQHLLATCFRERIESIFADAASPSENEELVHEGGRESERKSLDWSPRVVPIVFSKYKMYGVGEIRRRLEQDEIILAPTFGGVKDLGFDAAMKQLKAYHTDENGNIVKENDHCPDALNCLCVGLATSFRGFGDPTALHKKG